VLLSLGEKDFHLFEDYSLEVDLSRHREDFGGDMVGSFDPDLCLVWQHFHNFLKNPFFVGSGEWQLIA